MQPVWGDSIWRKRRAEAPTYTPLDRDITCDAVVVGGGITGALVTHELVTSGVDTVLLERDHIACGSTTASTSLLLYELDVRLHELMGMVGVEAAVRSYQLCREAIGRLRDLCAELPGGCEFETKPSLYLASSAGDVDGLKMEAGLRRSHGIPAEFLSSSELRRRVPFNSPAAILSPDAAQANPVEMTRHLIDRAGGLGMRVHEHTPVLDFRPRDDGIEITTGAGCRVRARRMIVASGYHAAQEFDVRVNSATTYALASEPLGSFDGWWERCLIWETARPYIYLRTTSDGRAVIGGEDDAGLTPPTSERLEIKWRTLERKFEALFPSIGFHPAAAWAGSFMSTRDGLPYIGPKSDVPNVLFALCYGGNGMVFSAVAAQIIRDLVRGCRNDDAHLFGFGR